MKPEDVDEIISDLGITNEEFFNMSDLLKLLNP